MFKSKSKKEKVKEVISVRDIIQVDREILENISNLIEIGAEKSLLNIFADLHPADIAEIINRLDFDDAKYAFNILSTEDASDVLLELDDNLREKILKETAPDKISDLVDELETDDATDIVSELPDDVADHVLKTMDKEDSIEVKELLKYPEDSAGGLMNSDFVYVYDTATIKGAIRELRKHSEEYEHIYYVYVLTKEDKLVGVISIKSLLLNDPRTRVKNIMEEDLIYITPEVDQEKVAQIMEKYDLVSIPVVDSEKVMLGRITIDDIVDVIHEEASEDIQRIAGLSEEQEKSDSALRVSRIRLPWLFVGLFGELMNALILSNYQDMLEKFVIATFFFPVIMAVGGSSGTQAAIVMVRGFSTGDVWISESLKKLTKEFFVALLNGLILSAVLFGITYYFFQDQLNFIIVLSISFTVVIVIATMLGAFIPIILKKLGADPAIATGPFVTTLNDILGLSVYLIFVTIFIT
ncbi:MAG: magnesium transporter [Ignavibacteriales bacterium]|nr:magnesium transporter [Ignavibacteriales bacterium]